MGPGFNPQGGGGNLQALLQRMATQHGMGAPGQAQVNVGASALPMAEKPPPNPFASPQTPVPGMPPPQQPQVNPIVAGAAAGGANPQQGQPNAQTPLQKLLQVLGPYLIGSLLAGGNKHGTPLVGPSAGANMWH
jgi:hypothetical protein